MYCSATHVEQEKGCPYQAPATPQLRRCLDQCCCVSFHGTSSSQGWRKMVVQSKFDPWVYILVFAECDLCRFVWESLPTEAYPCWHQCFSVVGWNSHDSRWPELNMFGSRPWCSFPWQKLVPKLVQTNCCINLIDEFTSLFSPKLVFAGLLRHAFVDAS